MATKKLTNIIFLIDICHRETLYLSILQVANSIISVNKLTEAICSLPTESNLTN